MKKIQFLLAIIVLLLILGACNDEAENDNDAERIVPVETAEIKQDDLNIDKSVYGKIEPKDLTPITLAMPGELTELHVENGDNVKEDDLIAKVMTEAGIQEVKAPAEGEIAQLSVEENAIVTDEEPLAFVANMDELTISFHVTSKIRSLFEDIDKVSVTVEGETYDAHIQTVEKIPEDTGLYLVKAILKNEDEKVLPGMTGVTSIPEEKLTDAMILPTEAVIEESDGAFVYKIEDDQATKVGVTIVESQTDVTAIEGEIDVGDEVVINGQLTLTDGARVEVMKEGNES